ncbi:MAG: zinc-dependent metalloprotease [Actinomycetota bacterium]|nr:zinc-dependent metalloprotease [Actinomycetota bacterium]
MSGARIAWPLAVRMAGKVAGSYGLEGTYHDALLSRQAPEFVHEASRMVEEETGLRASGEPRVVVTGRQQWVANNVQAFSLLLAPAEKRFAERVKGLSGAVAGRVMAAEVGALLGLLARRVLGQYDLVLPTGGDSGGEAGDTVLFVGPNVLLMERLHAFRPAEFRMWLALHECTHRLQFTGVPWMRDHFLGLIQELVASAVPEPRRLVRVAGELRRSAATGQPLLGEAGLIGLLATPAQRQLLDRVQALMSLLEGHGHVVMDRVGARTLVTQERMSRVLRRRRQDLKSSLFFRLTGLELKLSQYELGERFVLEVESKGGRGSLDRVWGGPELLPTLEEIRRPTRWLARVA